MEATARRREEVNDAKGKTVCQGALGLPHTWVAPCPSAGSS